jgi:hypothetical protein
MKSRLLLGVAAALSLAPANAYAEASGYFGVGFTGAEIEFDAGGGEAEIDTWGVEGAVAFEASPGIGVQVGASFVDVDGGESAFGLDGHINLRTERHLIGVFAGTSEVSDETAWTVGGEGELYLSNVTLAGAAGYAAVDVPLGEVEAWGVNGELRYFLTDNLRVEGELGFANIDFVGEVKLTSVGVGAEYKLSGAPFSIVGGYTHSESEDSPLQPDNSTNAFTIGGRYTFGGTLLHRDREGASLPGLSGVLRALRGF